MNILYVCHRVPFPPKRGGKIRPFNMIRHFSEQGHTVTVASLARSESEREEASGLREHCSRLMVEVIGDAMAAARMVARAPTSVPASFGYFWSPRLARSIADSITASPPDLVFVHCSSVAPYVSGLRGMAKIIDFGDMDSQKWREYAQHRSFPMASVYQLEAWKLERTERRLTSEFDLATCTTQAELESLNRLGSRCPTGWFPNGVDTDFFAPAEAPPDPDTIVFVGRMDYYPNQQGVTWFCEQVWPSLRARLPQLKLLIVGADPSQQILELGRIEGVTVTGSVPDVRPFVHRAFLTIAPLFIARGTQNKILESLAMGVPVVCSREAAGGVNAVDGEHVLVADGAPDWAGTIECLLADPARRESMARDARQQMLTQHSWPASMRRLDQLVDNTMQRKQS